MDTIIDQTTITDIKDDKATEKLFTQADIDKVLADRLAREQKKLEKQMAEFKTEQERQFKLSQMTDAEQQTEKQKQLEAELEQLRADKRNNEVRALKSSVLKKHEMADDLVDFIKGENEEEITKNTKKLLNLFNDFAKVKGPSVPNSMNNGKIENKTPDMDAFDRTFKKYYY